MTRPIAHAVGKQVFFGPRHIADAVDELAAALIVQALNDPAQDRGERAGGVGSFHDRSNAA